MKKAIKRLLIGLISTILTVAIILVGIYVFILVKYDINLFSTIGQLKTLSQTVDENKLCPEAFSDDDMVDVQTEVNKSVEDFITYTEEHGYTVHFNELPEEMKYIIKLTDKQVGALAETVVKQEMGGKIDVGGNEIGLALKQVDFSEITETSALFNTVIRLDITSVKSSLGGFPFDMLKKYIPDYFYISSTVSVTHDNQPFVYTVTHNAITVNNLSAADTEDLFHTLDVVLKTGSAQSFNEKIGNTLLGTLIGDETQTGVAYSLKEIGAADYAFLADEDGEYFAVLRGEDLPPIPDIPEAHKHDMEHIESEQATCTGDGNVEYWHCKSCNKDFADESGSTEIKDVTVSASGHFAVPKADENKHWQECKYCSAVLSEGLHSATAYLKNKTGHCKVCSDCGVTFAVGAHTGDPCSTCGYTADYAEKCASDYGYQYLGTLTGGAKYQSFYNKLDETASAFHDDTAKNANAVSVSGSTSYVAGEINYSSLGLTTNEAISVWTTYRTDHPLYYWIAGNIVYSSASLSLCVDETYKNGGVRTTQNDTLYEAIDEYLNFAGGETSDYQIAFALHDKIIDDIDYARDTLGNPSSENWAHSVIGVFINGEAVCEGYAKAFSLLLNACGVENAYVSGTSKGEGHAWNMAQINGNWYWYDLTWDDQPHIGDGIIYDYFCVSGTTFADHVTGITGDMSNPMNFLYVLPDTATAAYNTEAIEYGESFTSGGYTYEVCGYNEVALIAATTATGSVNLTDVAHDGRTYALSEIGKDAFKNNKTVTALVVPTSVEVIYNFAFNGCTALVQVTFADKTGWRRTSQNGTFEVSSASLATPTAAATLLKETYNTGGLMYQYVWTKSVI